MEKYRREMDKLYAVANTSGKQYYTSKKSDGESYFLKRNGVGDVYIREYGFETLSDLKKELDQMWAGDETMQDCMQAVLIAALKMKPTDRLEEKVEEGQCSDDQPERKLSPFIYNF